MKTVTNTIVAKPLLCRIFGTCLVCLLVLGATAHMALAQTPPTSKTEYNAQGDFFHTTGKVNVSVPYTVVGKIAANFGKYRDWGLHEINKNKDGKSFSILFKDVVFRRGGRGGLGIFRIRFDLDWPWPLGAKNKELDFAILQADTNGAGGINRLVIDLERKGRLLKTFRLDLKATGTKERSQVTFESKVRFNTVVDTFFSLERFRENIEYRIVKVIQNLQRHAEETAAAGAESSE